MEAGSLTKEISTLFPLAGGHAQESPWASWSCLCFWVIFCTSSLSFLRVTRCLLISKESSRLPQHPRHSRFVPLSVSEIQVCSVGLVKYLCYCSTQADILFFDPNCFLCVSLNKSGVLVYDPFLVCYDVICQYCRFWTMVRKTRKDLLAKQ